MVAIQLWKQFPSILDSSGRKESMQLVREGTFLSLCRPVQIKSNVWVFALKSFSVMLKVVQQIFPTLFKNRAILNGTLKVE